MLDLQSKLQNTNHFFKYPHHPLRQTVSISHSVLETSEEVFNINMSHNKENLMIAAHTITIWMEPWSTMLYFDSFNILRNERWLVSWMLTKYFPLFIFRVWCLYLHLKRDLYDTFDIVQRPLSETKRDDCYILLKRCLYLPIIVQPILNYRHTHNIFLKCACMCVLL